MPTRLLFRCSRLHWMSWACLWACLWAVSCSLLLGCQGGLELLQCLVHEIMEQYALLFNTLLDVRDLQVIQGPILVGCSALCWTRMLLLR